MKKLPIVLLAILMVFSLFSCVESEIVPPEEYTVSFENITKDPVKIKEGEKFILPADMPSQEGYELIVKMGEEVLVAGKEYEITADTVLQCIWVKIEPEVTPGVKRTVSFDMKDKDGNAITRDPVTVDDGAVFIVPEDLRNGITVPDGSAFVISNNGKQLYPGNSITVTSDITINCTVLKGTDDLNIVDGVVQAKTDETKYTGDIVIPEKTNDGNPVTDIGDLAFYNCSNMTSISIPDSITSIGQGAFELCENLTSISIPNSVTIIADWAFSGCKNLTTITIPDSVAGIGKGAFNLSGLTEIHIPAKVEFVTDNPFIYCNELKTMTVDLNNKTLKSQDNCILSKDGTTLLSLASEADIPAGITKIGDSACAGMNFSSGTITIPEGVASIGKEAFAFCSTLTSMTIPDGVANIGDWAFAGCSSLTSIIIPDGVANIGAWTFSDCTNLTTINVCKPESKCKDWGENWHGGHEVNYDYTPSTTP